MADKYPFYHPLYVPNDRHTIKVVVEKEKIVKKSKKVMKKFAF